MRARLVLGIVVGVLALSTGVAGAQGPSGGELTGDGLAAPIGLSGGEGTGTGDGLIMQTGFFAATFREVPDPMLDRAPGRRARPEAHDHVAPEPDAGFRRVTQDIYPYADGGPLTYMAPGQRFYTSEQTRGGWYRSSPALLTTLQQLGVPPETVLIANMAAPTPPARPAPVDAAPTTRLPRGCRSVRPW